MFPSNGVMTWRPLRSTGSLGVVPPLQRYYGTLRLPAVHLDPFDIFTSRYHRVARGLLPSVVGVLPGARELSVPVSPSGLTDEGSRRLVLSGLNHTTETIPTVLHEMSSSSVPDQTVKSAHEV